MNMDCMICDSLSKYAFSKEFSQFGLRKVDYWTCTACGFTISKTHKEMSKEQWETLNRECHAIYQGSDNNLSDPRWLERLNAQTASIQKAHSVGLLPDERAWLDYACGDGKLSTLLKATYGLDLLNFDSYMKNSPDYLDADDFVITTSVFEHLTERRHFNAIESLVSTTGVMGIHTLVRETIPTDPEWFYLQATHCAFHTNRSMQILFDQWGYRHSAYHVESRLWLWFKTKIELNTNCEDFIYSDKFVDYWK
jgi:hypothetical protein